MTSLAWVFAGLFLTNSVPHLVAGLQGRTFQTPFARPRGQGHSSSTTNVVWGWFNLLAGWALLCVGDFNPRNVTHVLTLLPAIAGSVWLARRFGRFNGGNTPTTER